MNKKTDWGAYGYLLPVFGIMLAFQVLPIFYSLAISFYEWDLIGAARWVGTENFRRLFDDPMFFTSLWNTFWYSIISVPLGIIASLAVAMLLNNKLAALGFYRTVYFIPVITSINAVAIVWNFIYHPDYGLLNKLFAIVGMPSDYKWLQDPQGIGPFFLGLFYAAANGVYGALGWVYDSRCLHDPQGISHFFQSIAGLSWPAWIPEGPSVSMFCIIVMSVWKGLGYNVIIFLAGLQNIPKHLYEAARIDGASRIQQFRHITWPLLSPTSYFIFVMSIIGSFQVFSQVYMMTPRGGPLKTTMVLVYYVYNRAFERFEFGYALAMAFALSLMIMAMTLFNKFYLEKKVHYS